MALKYSALKKTPKFDDVMAGAIVGVRFILADDPAVSFIGVDRGTGGISGFTVSQQIEALPVESVGTRLADQIVRGRFSGTASVNGFFSLRKGDEFVPDSETFTNLQWHCYRYQTEGSAKGVPFDAVTYWTIASCTIPQGARGLVTFEMSGPFIERLRGERAAKRFGVY